VNFGVKWWLGFGGGSYIRVRVKMVATLGLGFEDGGYFRVRELLYKDVCE
jgi:hypothetical protein